MRFGWRIHEVRFMRDGIRKVRFRPGEIYASNLVKFFTP